MDSCQEDTGTIPHAIDINRGWVKLSSPTRVGYGLYATRFIKKGDEIICEQPFFSIPSNSAGTGPNEAALLSEVEHLDIDGLEEHDRPFPEYDTDRPAALVAVYKNYAIRMPEHPRSSKDTAWGVFRWISAVNHSCVPNVRINVNTDTPHGIPEANLVAVSNIQYGEELVRAYVDGIGDIRGVGGVLERRKTIRKRFGFECECPKCVRECKFLDVNWEEIDLLELEDGINRAGKRPQTASRLQRAFGTGRALMRVGWVRTRELLIGFCRRALMWMWMGVF